MRSEDSYLSSQRQPSLFYKLANDAPSFRGLFAVWLTLLLADIGKVAAVRMLVLLPGFVLGLSPIGNS